MHMHKHGNDLISYHYTDVSGDGSAQCSLYWKAATFFSSFWSTRSYLSGLRIIFSCNGFVDHFVIFLPLATSTRVCKRCPLSPQCPEKNTVPWGSLTSRWQFHCYDFPLVRLRTSKTRERVAFAKWGFIARQWRIGCSNMARIFLHWTNCHLWRHRKISRLITVAIHTVSYGNFNT